MAAQLPIQETVDASDAVFSSRTPSDAELSFDDKRRSPTKRSNGDREQGLLQSEYRNATEMACASTLKNGGVEDADVDNTGDWKNTPGGNPNRFHPLWGPPIPRKGMTMTIGNGSKSEKIEWDPFFGPPVVKSRGIPKLTKSVEDGGILSQVGLMANYHWEGLDNGPISSPALSVPQPYLIGAPPGGGMMMNPQQHQQQYQHQQQLNMFMQHLQQQQANGQPITPQQQQHLLMMQQQQHQITMGGGGQQQQQYPQFQQQMLQQQGGQQQQAMSPQQQQALMQQMQMQQQAGGQPLTPQQQHMMMQQRMQQHHQQQQPNNGNLANQQQQQYPTYTQQQPQPQQPGGPVLEQHREPYTASLSAQSSLGIELDTVARGTVVDGGGNSSAVSSSLDVDGATARRLGTSPPIQSNQVEDDDL